PLVYAEVGRRHGSRRTPEEIAVRFAAAFRREEQIDRDRGWRTDEDRERRRWQNIVAHVFDDLADAGGCFEELFARFGPPEAWRCDPEAANVLGALGAAGKALALASNYDRRLRSVAVGLPPSRMIPHWVISSEVGWRKPAPEFFQAVCDRLGLPAERVLYV